MSIFQDHVAEIEDGGKIVAHLSFEFLDLLMGELIFGVVKDLFWQHFEYEKVVLADVHIFGGGAANLADEISPGCIPFVFNYFY